MIFVDTSVWVEALRDRSCESFRHLDQLLDSDNVAMPIPVRVELLGGVSRAQRASLARALSGLPVYYPTDATWIRIDGWVQLATEQGQRFGFADLLIASLAAQAALPLWSLDRDFGRMADLGFIELHRPG